MTLPRFTIEPEPDTGEYRPALIHARMTMVDSTGAEVAVPMEIVSVELAPQGIVEIEPSTGGGGTEPVLEFLAQLTQQALADKDLAAKVKDPILVTFVATPEPETEGGPAPPQIRRQCEILVEVPDGEIHWCDEDTPDSEDQVLHLDADGETELRLRVRFDRYDPEAQRVVYDPEEVEFTHLTGPETQADVFAAAADDLPHDVAGESNNRDLTRWKTKVALPDDAHPDLVPPIDTHIRVRVWPRGSITRSPGAIDASGEGAKRLGEAFVPLVLEPVRQTAELLEPTEPIPADGSAEHRLVVRLTQQRNNAPVTSGTFTFELDAAKGAGGSLDAATATVTMTKEMDGRVELSYTAPELSYRLGGRYEESLIVFRGGGAKRMEVARLPVYLSPSVEAQVVVEKAGLEWEETTIEFVAGETPSTVKGVLKLQVVNDDPARTAEFLVAFADVSLLVGPEETEVGPLTSDGNGQFVWELPELKVGLAKASPERRERMLEEGWIECDFDEDAALIIDTYDDKVGEHAPFHLFPPPLTATLKSHRLVFGEQIARLKPDLLAKVLAATEYLRTGVVHGRSWENIYRNQVGTALDPLANFFTELVGIAVNCVNFGDKIAGVASSVVRWVEQNTAGAIQYVIRWVTTDFAFGIQLLARSVKSILDRISTMITTPTLQAIVESMKGAWTVAGEAISSLLAKGRGALGDLLVGVIDVLANLFRLIVNSIAGFALIVFELIGRVGAEIAERVGRYLVPLGDATFRRWEEALRTVFHNALRAEDSFGTWGLGKLCELVYGAILEKLAAMERAANWTGAQVRAALDPAPGMISKAVTLLESATRQIPQIPVPPEDRLMVFRQAMSSAAEDVRQFQGKVIYAEMVSSIIDTATLCVEIGLAAIGTLFTVGILNPVTLGPAFTNVEIGLGIAKSVLIHLPAIYFSISGGTTILNGYGLNMVALTDPGAGASP